MGKVVKTGKSSQAVKSTRVLKQNGIVKPNPRYQYYLKRDRMAKRRIESLLNEKKCRDQQNKDFSDRLKTEQMLSATLRKESFHWQRLYHEAVVTINTYKVKQAEMVQAMSACLRENDSIFPHMVALSESITSNKVRLTHILNKLPSSEYNCLPRQFRDTGKISEESMKMSEKPMKQRVGPMVRGLLITKPKIMLERVMLPQPQIQEPVNNGITHSEENNNLTPIPEEDEHLEHQEELCLSRISKRPKRKLGSSWRVRRQEKMEKNREKQMERGTKSPSSVAYDDDSSDTESNPPGIDHMEPVVRFKDVSRLLQNSSLLKIDTNHNGNAEGGGSSASRLPEAEARSLKRAPEDPLEGSSWMFTNNHRSSFRSPQNNKGRSSLLHTSDSDDDDDDDDDDDEEGNGNIVVTQKDVHLRSSLDTLEIEHSNTYSISSPSHVTPFNSSSPQAEPDSTNNIDVQLNSISSKKSFENVSRSSSSASIDRSPLLISNSPTELNSKNMTPPGQRISVSRNALIVSLSKVVDFNRSSTNASHKQSKSKISSGFCNSCSPVQSPLELSGKRTRKPKNHFYPGEDESPVQLKKKKSLRQKEVTGKKNSIEKNKSKGIKKSKKRLSGGIASSAVNSNPCGSSRNSGKDIQKSVNDVNAETEHKPIKRSVTKNKTGARTSLKLSVGSSKTVAKSKKKSSVDTNKKSTNRSVKNSLNSSQRTSSGIQLSFEESQTSTRAKRNKQKISYKEVPLNVKQRRP